MSRWDTRRRETLAALTRAQERLTLRPPSWTTLNLLMCKAPDGSIMAAVGARDAWALEQVFLNEDGGGARLDGSVEYDDVRAAVRDLESRCGPVIAALSAPLLVMVINVEPKHYRSVRVTMFQDEWRTSRVDIDGEGEWRERPRGPFATMSDAMADAEEHIWTPGPRPLVCADIIVATAMLKARFPGGGWEPNRGEIFGEFHGRGVMLRWTGEGWAVNGEYVDGDPVVAFGTWAEKTFN